MVGTATYMPWMEWVLQWLQVKATHAPQRADLLSHLGTKKLLINGIHSSCNTILPIHTTTPIHHDCSFSYHDVRYNGHLARSKFLRESYLNMIVFSFRFLHSRTHHQIPSYQHNKVCSLTSRLKPSWHAFHQPYQHKSHSQVSCAQIKALRDESCKGSANHDSLIKTTSIQSPLSFVHNQSMRQEYGSTRER